jgi:hypothetical protein
MHAITVARWRDGAGHPHRSWHWACSSRSQDWLPGKKQTDIHMQLFPGTDDRRVRFQGPGENRARSGQALAMVVSHGRRVYGVSPSHRAGCKFCVPGIPPSTMIAPRDFRMGPVGRQEPGKLSSSEILGRPTLRPRRLAGTSISPCIQPQCWRRMSTKVQFPLPAG